MAACSPREDAIIDHLRREFGHVSAERVASGMGLENLYRAVLAVDQVEAPQRNSAEITKAALDGECPIARAALELFCGMLGTIAGNSRADVRRPGRRLHRRRHCSADYQLPGAIGISRAIRKEGTPDTASIAD